MTVCGMHFEVESPGGPEVTMTEFDESTIIFAQCFATNTLVHSEFGSMQQILGLMEEAHFCH